MKTTVLLFLVLLIFPFHGTAQTIKDIDYISPYHEDVAAIKKGEQWAFIDTTGSIIIDFRNDLATTEIDNTRYPIFKKGRCLIMQKKEGISYFGFIDKTGKTVIEPQFLNATNFNTDNALVLKLVREDVGKNQLNKDVYYYKYFEVLINTNGDAVSYLLPEDATYIALDRSKLPVPPKFQSKMLSNIVFATLGKNNKWTIKQLQ